MAKLNYRHLRYFWAVAHDGNLTRTAQRLNLSQSALSTQIRQLEARLGHDLFERRGRALHLTEAGRLALDHADTIFETGAELLDALADTGRARRAVRIGALSTLSRNFQLHFLQPLLGRSDTEIVLRSASGREAFEALETLALDVVLSNAAPQRDALSPFLVHKLAEQRVGLFGRPDRVGARELGALLEREPVVLPTAGTIRTAFDSLAARLSQRPQIAAEVDDMAMIRLLAREGAGLAVVPAVVLEDELDAGLLAEAPFDLDISESFFAVTVDRRFPNPVVKDLIEQARRTAQTA